jgi:histidinol-phosphate phosphatase family protein
VLFDRDGTLVANVPYNRSPEAVRAMPGAAAALDRLRRRGVRIGVVTNQSGVALGLISLTQLAAVHRRVEELLGPIDTWQVYRHRPDEGCGCRKPAPGLVQRAAAALGLSPSECAVVGDIGADVAAAEAAGARGVLVPTAASQAREAAGATCAPDLATAIDLLIGPETGLIGPETGLRPGRSAEAPGDEWHDGTAAEPEAVVRGALR